MIQLYYFCNSNSVLYKRIVRVKFVDESVWLSSQTCFIQTRMVIHLCYIVQRVFIYLFVLLELYAKLETNIKLESEPLQLILSEIQICYFIIHIAVYYLLDR